MRHVVPFWAFFFFFVTQLAPRHVYASRGAFLGFFSFFPFSLFLYAPSVFLFFSVSVAWEVGVCCHT